MKARPSSKPLRIAWDRVSLQRHYGSPLPWGNAQAVFLALHCMLALVHGRRSLCSAVYQRA